MKAFGKNVLDDFHINPINRDLVLVLISGVLVALAISSLTVMMLGQR